MFHKLSFTARILVLPAVAATAFLALLATTQIFNVLDGRQLSRVEQGLYPSLVLNSELAATLKEVRRGLQDAVTFESVEAIEPVDELRDGLLRRLTEAKANPLIDPATLSQIETLFGDYYDLARQTSTRIVSGETGDQVFEDIERTGTLFEELQLLLTATTDKDRTAMEEAFARTRSSQRTTLLVSLIVAALSLAVLGWFSRGVLASVRTLAREVTASSMQINAASAEVLAATRLQEQASSQHAGAIEETRRTVESLAESSRAIAEQAGAVLQNAQRTQSTNQQIADRNAQLMSRLEGITTILESVKDIASKSELLALNAALEGTKAGEAGRGFSLVAAQMQRLAENVMANVQDIKQLTREIRDASHSAVLAIEEGTKLSDQTTRSAGQIRKVTQQQESATEQVTQSMADAALQVQQTVSSVRQSTEAMESLAQLATQLNQILDDLRLGDSGLQAGIHSGTGTHASPPARRKSPTTVSGERQ